MFLFLFINKKFLFLAKIGCCQLKNLSRNKNSLYKRQLITLNRQQSDKMLKLLLLTVLFGAFGTNAKDPICKQLSTLSLSLLTQSLHVVAAIRKDNNNTAHLIK